MFANIKWIFSSGIICTCDSLVIWFCKQSACRKNLRFGVVWMGHNVGDLKCCALFLAVIFCRLMEMLLRMEFYVRKKSKTSSYWVWIFNVNIVYYSFFSKMYYLYGAYKPIFLVTYTNYISTLYILQLTFMFWFVLVIIIYKIFSLSALKATKKNWECEYFIYGYML